MGERIEQSPGSGKVEQIGEPRTEARLALEDLGDLRRTHYCGELRVEDAGKSVVLMGWVRRRRDLGELIFIDLADRTGIVQVVSSRDRGAQAFSAAELLRSEYVVAIEGTVTRRSPENVNPALPTGEIEVETVRIHILNTAKTPPFYIQDNANADENLRLKYRYLDLRRYPMLRNLELRHRAVKAVRDYLSSLGFWEIETPMMTRSTPEGARDYVVPVRNAPGKFFALAQSPQLFKQLLMVAGVDKYFQINRCFRDEDLRADRQPEFTQIDIEMSFAGEEEVFSLVEGLLGYMWETVLGVTLPVPFPRTTYREAMARYGTDKPDIRFGMEIHDVTEAFRGTQFKVVADVLGRGGRVKALVAAGQAGMSRSQVDALVEKAKEYGAKGLITLAYLDGEVRSPARKFLSESELERVREMSGAVTGDLVLCVAGEDVPACEALGKMRLDLGRMLGMIPKESSAFLWVTEFPLLKVNEDTGEWEAAHHPFTSPVPEDLERFEELARTDRGAIRARSYDVVLNGVELASGSIRIHRRDLQEKVFRVLGLNEEEARKRFGFLLEAFEYGAPPHGGIAFGMDRLVMMMAGAETIREVIAFPKTSSGTCVMTDAPAPIDREKLEELGLEIKKPDAGRSGPSD